MAGRARCLEAGASKPKRRCTRWYGKRLRRRPTKRTTPFDCAASTAPQALELALLTRPGPFGPRTPELGEYFGYFDGDRLVAMAGERMAAESLREISGVCTHPDHRGRGHARKLMLKLVRRQLQRGETPFLHVMRDNASARELYQRMGFGIYRESVVRVIAPD